MNMNNTKPETLSETVLGNKGSSNGLNTASISTLYATLLPAHATVELSRVTDSVQRQCRGSIDRE